MDLRAEKLSMSFDDAGSVVEVFSDLSLSVGEGESLAVVGESGSGKTTLLYLLGGLEEAVSGDVLVGGNSYNQMRAEGRDLAEFRGDNIGFVFQFHHLLPEFNALENVMMPMLIQGIEPGEAEGRAEKLLGKTGLSHRLTHRPGALSGGEQQRVAVARAFANSPGIVLADEPTGNLDARTGRQVSEMLKQFQEEEKVTLVVVTHSRELASEMDRTLTLDAHGLST